MDIKKKADLLEKEIEENEKEIIDLLENGEFWTDEGLCISMDGYRRIRRLIYVNKQMRNKIIELIP